MSNPENTGAVVSRTRLVIFAGVILIYCFWIYGLSANPPGFYIDESCIAYNGYLLATTGAQEDGKTFPLYIHCYTQNWSQYMSAGQPYALAALYLFVSPSVLSARIFAATLVFLAILLLGLLASRISGSTSVGIIVALSGMATPWLFEYSRLVMETFVLILAITLFLFLLYRAQKRRWKTTDTVVIAISLTLITYSYATGRVIGPLFSLGLLIFAVNLRALFDVFKVWVIYALTMIPMIVVYLQDPRVISGRFMRATNLSREKSFLENIGTVLSALYEDISLKFLVTDGDRLLRHHVPNSGMGEFLVAIFALGLLGIVIVLIRHRSSPWWRFILFGAIASLLPGAITYERYHSMRGLAFPIFFLILTIPAISWLLGLYGDKTDALSDISGNGLSFFRSSSERYLRLGVLSILLLLTAVQAVQFQRLFWKNGMDPGRKAVFNESYPRVLDRALAETDRPIYLHDFGEPSYIHALWYGAIKGVDASNFVHILDRQSPPEGALVLSSKTTCDGCQIIYRDGGYMLYRNQKLDSSAFTVPVPADPATAPSVFSSGPGSEPGQFSRPRGLAADSKGNLYIADGGNGRIQKFDKNGKFLIEFGQNGTAETNLKDPNGVTVDADGNVYVVDVGTHRFTRFNAQGVFENVYDGAGTGFYGPRDLALAPNKHIYIVDQARNRIAGFDLEKNSYTYVWGTGGNGEGQFNGTTGITAGDGLVFVADHGNGRIQVFDLEGNFVRQWEVPSWTKYVHDTPDVVYDENTKIVYATACKTNEVLAFDIDGTPRPDMEFHDSEKLKDPGAMAIIEVEKKRWLYVLNRGNSTLVRFELAGKMKK